MRTSIIVGAFAAAVLLSACASTGVNVSENQLAFLQPGATTETEVVARLGQPTSRTRLADGSVLIQYVYAESRVKASTFVPVVGMFAGGVDTKSNAVTLRFGPDGKLADTTATTSGTGTTTGAAAGEP